MILHHGAVAAKSQTEQTCAPLRTCWCPRTFIGMQDGPLMIAATKILKPGPTRIARLVPGVTLPRTIPITTLFVVAGFSAFGLLVMLALPFFSSLTSILTGTVLFGGLGVVVTTYSPLKGESMLRWFGLEVSARRQRIEVNGEPAKVYIGLCPIDRVAVGEVRILPSAVEVPPGSVDSRGLPLKQRVFRRLEVRSDRPETAPQSVPHFVGGALDGWARASHTQPAYESPFSLGGGFNTSQSAMHASPTQPAMQPPGRR